MSPHTKTQINHLNDASDKIVKSQEQLQAEATEPLRSDKKYQVLQNKVNSVLEACANQQQVSREVYTEQNNVTGKKDFRKLNFTIGKVFRCSLCKNDFDTDKECKRHVLTTHRTELEKQGIYTCQHCGKDCGNNTMNLKHHLDKCLDGIGNQGGKMYNCPHCDHSFSIEHNMKSHSAACGKKLQDKDVKNNTQVCVLCGKTFEDEKEHLSICVQIGKIHVKKAPKEPCKFCGNVFPNVIEHELQCKQQTSISEPPEDNMETSQVGKQSADKEVHKESQRSKKVCKYCDKAFESLKNYEEHIENCKKLFCEKCKTKFETPKKYSNHARSCTNRKFVCLTCNKELKRSDSLLNHAQLHYPNRNSFTCPVCATKCLTEKELHMHIVEEHITV